jgi:hypothetical protein
MKALQVLFLITSNDFQGQYIHNSTDFPKLNFADFRKKLTGLPFLLPFIQIRQDWSLSGFSLPK